MARLNSNDYAVVWPRSAKAVEIKPLAKRLDGLEGKTIGQLWDDLFRGDEIFPILEGGAGAPLPRREVRRLRRLRLHARRRGAAGAGRAAGASMQATGGGRGHLRDGVLRELHARRVAGQRGCRAGRRPHRLARVRGLPRSGGHHRHGPRASRACRSRSCPATSMCRRSTSCAPTCSASRSRGDPQG